MYKMCLKLHNNYNMIAVVELVLHSGFFKKWVFLTNKKLTRILKLIIILSVFVFISCDLKCRQRNYLF